MVYSPGSRLAKLYTPASFEMTVVTTRVAVLVAANDTPGNTALVASTTVPLTVALLDWLNAWVAINTHNPTEKTSFLIVFPLTHHHALFRQIFLKLWRYT